MSEPGRENDPSLIGLATEKAERAGKALGFVTKVVNLELADVALQPDSLSPEARRDYEEFAAELAATLRDGLTLLSDVVKTTGIGLPEGGLADLLEIKNTRALPAPAPDPTPDPPPAPRPETRADPNLSVGVELNGRQFSAQELGLTSQYEVELLRLLSGVGAEPFARARIYDLGFRAKDNESQRSESFTRALAGITDKLHLAAGTEVLGRIGQGAATKYVILEEFSVDGQAVTPTDPDLLKKK